MKITLYFSKVLKYNPYIKHITHSKKGNILMKKMTAMLLVLMLALSLLTACGGSNADTSDLAYVQKNGKMIVGITDYAPMDYKDENGEWIGFDADYARAVCAKLGVTAEFKEIEWDYKLMALESKDIDCVWNGMTITDAIEAAADCTAPYMYNTQVAVIKKADAEKYKTLEDLQGASIAAEGGSAGESVILSVDALKSGLKSVTAQSDALLEVLSGASDAAIVDLTLAKALINN